jgi:hypothetical protein
VQTLQNASGLTWKLACVLGIGAALAPRVSHAFTLTPDSLKNKLSAAEVKAGWVLLFDGVDKNAHWRNGYTGTAATTWVIDSGYMVPATGSGGTEISTKVNYSNFEFTMEWKQNIKGNSGIFYRVDSRSRPCSSTEWGILDDVNGDDRTALGHMPGETAMPIKRTAAAYDMYPTVQNGVVGSPYVGIAKPYAEWNQGVLWANDSLIEHWLNGQRVVNYKLGTPDWLQRFQFSKYYAQTGCPTAMNMQQTWGRLPTGLIGLQDHGGGLRIWIRNIKVRPFTPGEKLVSPLITPNGGTFSGPKKVIVEAAITGSTIRYTLDGSDPTETSPVYADSLMLSSSATVKTRTFRSLFQTSDVTSAAFTISGTGISRHNAGDFRVPQVSFTQSGTRLIVDNKNGVPITVDIVSPAGRTHASFHAIGGMQAYELGDLNAGIYLVKVRSAVGAQVRTQKIVIP